LSTVSHRIVRRDETLLGISYGIRGFDVNDLMDLRITSVLDLGSVEVAAAVGSMVVDMANVLDGEFADLAVWTTLAESCQ
jgi:energy-converting hydrogenase Eha subunit G